MLKVRNELLDGLHYLSLSEVLFGKDISLIPPCGPISQGISHPLPRISYSPHTPLSCAILLWVFAHHSALWQGKAPYDTFLGNLELVHQHPYSVHRHKNTSSLPCRQTTVSLVSSCLCIFTFVPTSSAFSIRCEVSSGVVRKSKFMRSLSFTFAFSCNTFNNSLSIN